MKINIESNTRFSDIQKAFHQLYPFLKMELASAFSKSATNVNTVPAETIPFILDIDGNTTIAELEADLLQRFQLPVQVLRKSGSMWIGTSLTKDWTLEHQNKEGELFSG